MQIRSPDDAVMHTWNHQNLVERGDPHDRLIFGFSKIDGVHLACEVTATWGEKSEIISKLFADVVLAEATTRLEHDAEVIRWMTRVREIVSVIELRVPTYINEPGRTLALIDRAVEIRREEVFQKWQKTLETRQRTDSR
jgi:hypothetical protein